jgi:hypothetical protein
VSQNTNITSPALLPLVGGRIKSEEFRTPVRDNIGQDRVNAMQRNHNPSATHLGPAVSDLNRAYAHFELHILVLFVRLCLDLILVGQLMDWGELGVVFLLRLD